MKKHILLLISISIIFLIACGRGMGESELKKQDKSPESLNDVSSGNDEVGSTLDEIERLVLNIPSDSQEDAESNDEEVGESTGEDQEQSESEETPEDEEEKKDKKVEETWLELEKKIEELYVIWNEYEVEGQKKGGTKEQFDYFEDALNQLTISVENKNIISSYNYLSQSFLALRSIFDLYQDDIMGELSNLKYIAYRAYYTGIGDTDTNFEILADNEDIYNRIRHKLDDDSKEDLIKRLENSLVSFNKSLGEGNRRINMIKKNIVLENINELQD